MDSISHKISNANITEEVEQSLRLIEDLKFFLATAPANWQENQVVRRYYLNHDEGFVSCVFWNNLYFITGTDIVRCIVYKFQHFGRKIIDRKKFEEGIFSDLRNLKTGADAILETPKSPFLDFLYRNSCLRTQKKQKVFYWFNVPHDKLMADALERDLKKEKMGQKPTTIADREPALSFKYEEEKLLYKQLMDYKNEESLESEEKKDSRSKKSPEYTTSSLDPAGSETVVETVAGTVAAAAAAVEATASSTELPSEPPADPPPNPTADPTAAPDDDDFPLDYFQEDSSDYISLDTNYRPNFAYLLEDYGETTGDSLVVSSNPLVVNDDYLIQQTQPVKTPLPPLLPKSATGGKFAGPLSAGVGPGPGGPGGPGPIPAGGPGGPGGPVPAGGPWDEYHMGPVGPLPGPLPAPLSAKFQQSFPRHLHGFDPVYVHNEPYSYYDPTDYWAPYPDTAASPMYVMNDYDPSAGPIPAPFPMMNPGAVPWGGPPPIPSPAYAGPSSRQQQISANMMRKKRQLKQPLAANTSRASVQKPDRKPDDLHRASVHRAMAHDKE